MAQRSPQARISASAKEVQSEARDGGRPSTRQLLLHEASKLFARRGYYGTSTHAIAKATGIRQPSLFYHFTSKQELMKSILAYDLDEPARRAKAIVDAKGSPASRLYCFVHADTAHLAASPYNLVGLHRDEVLREPEFRAERRKEQQIYASLFALISEGVASGELRDVDRRMAQELIVGLNDNTMRLAADPAHPSGDLPRFVADFALRALLQNPDDLDPVRIEADRLGKELGFE
jgi:AcrR family transcriptional regulator